MSRSSKYRSGLKRQDGNYFVGSELSMCELESIDEIISSVLKYGYVDLGAREFEHYLDRRRHRRLGQDHI